MAEEQKKKKTNRKQPPVIAPYQFDHIPPEEAQRIRSMGGKASGEKKREKKKLKEELLLLLSDGDTQKNVCLALITEAMNGNVKAFETLRDTIGQKPVDKQVLQVEDSNINITIDNDEPEPKS